MLHSMFSVSPQVRVKSNRAFYMILDLCFIVALHLRK